MEEIIEIENLENKKNRTSYLFVVLFSFLKRIDCRNTSVNLN